MSFDIVAANLVMLQTAFGAGSVTGYKVFKALDNAGLTDKKHLEQNAAGVLEAKAVEKIMKVHSEDVLSVLSDCRDNGIELLTIKDSRYPERLRNISAPPLVLYIKGTLIDFDSEPVFAIVGPRKVSEYGRKAAYSLALRLTKAGMTVISGGALGADTYAHKGALSAGGKTIAVLGCGIEHRYLMENASLRKVISENGCLISEYPPFEKCTRYSFPVRNRLVSALSVGTAVVEAEEGSGSLITARCALEQGKEVFVIPGNPSLAQYAGSNALLGEGAFPLTDAKSILKLYKSRFGDKIDIEKAYEKTERPPKSRKIIKKSSEGLSKAAKIVYNYLDKQKFTADDLLGSGVSDDELLSSLTELEMEHLIRSLPGGMYELIR